MPTDHKRGHGARCDCLACSTLMHLARRIVEHNPLVRPSDLEPSVRDFVFYLKNGKERVSLWADEREGGAMMVVPFPQAEPDGG